MSFGSPGVAANNIEPSRFVKKTTNDYEFDKAGANDFILGITQVGTNTAPIPGVSSTYAAAQGQTCRIHKSGERTLLSLGGTVTAGDLLKSDANGQGVTVASLSTVQNYGARALQSGNLNELIEVEVIIGSQTAT